MSAARTIPRPVARDEWLAARRPHFNASAAGVLFGRHPFLTDGDYATIKLTGEEQAPTRAMERGRRFEDVIAQWWADDNGCKVVEPDVLYVRDRVMATVDRVVTDRVVGTVATGTPIEVKSTARRVHEPEQYWLDQCQAIMYVVDVAEMVLVWLDSSMEIHDRELAANPQFGNELAARADQFMAAIDLGVAPDWITLSYDNLAALYPHPAGRVDLDDDTAELVNRLDLLRLIRRDAEADEKIVKDQLARALADNEAGAWRGRDIITWKATRPSQVIDTKKLAEENPDLVARYMVERPGARRMLTHLEVA